jgi:hypothetical protein
MATADEGEEDFAPGFSSDEDGEDDTASPSSAQQHTASQQLAPEVKQRVELKRRRALALR